MEFLKNKHEQVIFLVVSLILAGVGYCMHTFVMYRYDIAVPLMTIATSIAILSVIHLFLPDKFFKTFRTLTFLYLGIAFIFIFLFPPQRGGGLFSFDIYPLDEKKLSGVLSNFYYALSLSIIFYHFVTHKLGRLLKKKPWQIFSFSVALVILAWMCVSVVMYITGLWEYFEYELFYALLTLMIIFHYPYTFLVQLF